MKKRIIALLITLSTLLSLFPATTFANSGVKVAIDGKTIEFDVEPQIINGRTMVPLRAIFEGLGAQVTWEDSIKTATAIKDNYSVSITINANNMYKEDSAIPLDAPAKIVNGRTLVPARAIAESFGCDVNWDAENKTVKITTAEEETEEKPFAFETLKNFLVENGEYNDDKGYFLTKKRIFKDTNLTITYNPDNDVLLQTIDYYDLTLGLVFSNDNSATLDDSKVYAIITLRDLEPSFVGVSKNKISHTIDFEGNLEELMAEFYDDYTINGTSAKTDFAPIVEGIIAQSYLLWESKGLNLHPDDLLYVDTTPTEPQTMTMYSGSGESKKIYISQMNAYLNNGWLKTPAVTMYALDGRTMVVEKSRKEEYKSSGWYETPVITMYAPDGRSKEVYIGDVPDEVAVGWYTEPVTTMYAPDGRTQIVPKSQVEANEKVGWYTEPLQTLYSPDGRTIVVKKSEVASYKKIGWYEDSACTPKIDYSILKNYLSTGEELLGLLVTNYNKGLYSNCKSNLSALSATINSALDFCANADDPSLSDIEVELAVVMTWCNIALDDLTSYTGYSSLGVIKSSYEDLMLTARSIDL